MMRIGEARKKVFALMLHYGLSAKGWKYIFTNHKIVPHNGSCWAGMCDLSNRIIYISDTHSKEYPWREIKKVVLHEICHALVLEENGFHNHRNKAWKDRCKEMGISCSSYTNLFHKYIVTCSCGGEWHRERQNKEDCYVCPACDNVLIFTKNPNYISAKK